MKKQYFKIKTSNGPVEVSGYAFSTPMCFGIVHCGPGWYAINLRTGLSFTRPHKSMKDAMENVEALMKSEAFVTHMSNGAENFNAGFVPENTKIEKKQPARRYEVVTFDDCSNTHGAYTTVSEAVKVCKGFISAGYSSAYVYDNKTRSCLHAFNGHPDRVFNISVKTNCTEYHWTNTLEE